MRQVLVWWVCVVVATGARADDSEYSYDVLGARDGLVPSRSTDVAQDAQGFIWIATDGGLFRWDGEEMTRWARDEIRSCRRIATSPRGDVIVSSPRSPVWRVEGAGVDTLDGPDGTPWIARSSPTPQFSRDGDLWVAERDGVWRRRADEWSRISNQIFRGERIDHVWPIAGDSAFVSTNAGLWRTTSMSTADRIGDARHVWDAIIVDDRLAYFIDGSRIGYWRWNGTDLDSLGIDIPEWGGVRDVYDGRTTHLRMVPYKEFSWLPFVDAEGGLWSASARGVLHAPAAGTRVIDVPAVRHLHLGGDTLHVSTWFDRVTVSPSSGGWSATPSGASQDDAPRSAHVVDGVGNTWTSTWSGGFWRRSPGGEIVEGPPDSLDIFDGHVRRNGETWLSTNHGLFLVPPDGGMPALWGSPPPEWGGSWPTTGSRAVLEDRRGRLWVSLGGSVCVADVDAGARPDSVDWTCVELPNEVQVRRVVQAASGRILAAGETQGLWVFDDATWRRHPVVTRIGFGAVSDLVPSPRGGVWVVANGAFVRIEDAPDTTPHEAVVLETLSQWEGLRTIRGGRLVETDGGDLWVTESGVTHVPRAVRDDPPTPPRVALVRARADGESVVGHEVDGLKHQSNQLELRFAALSFRDRSHLTYESSVNDGPWQAIGSLSLQFLDLPFGTYDIRFRASLDGHAWSADPVTFRAEVSRPWYLTWWGALLILGSLGGLLFAAHQIRTNHLLRLSRERVNIAMDLHDEIGAGLAAIGLSADASAERLRAGTAEPARLEAISREARAMSSSVSDLIWTLHDEPTLGALVSYVADRARRITLTNERLVVSVPDAAEAVRLTLVERRNLQLILIEALTNTAKHAKAQRVELGAARDRDASWRVWVEDDGVGIVDPPVADRPAGHYGLRNMRKRATSIGAECSITSPEAGTGTRVSVRLRLTGTTFRS